MSALPAVWALRGSAAWAVGPERPVLRYVAGTSNYAFLKRHGLL